MLVQRKTLNYKCHYASTKVQLHGLNVYQYVDDAQIYGCSHRDNSASLCGDFGICVKDVARWMCSNRLQLNARKTEFMWCVPPRRRHQLPVDQLTIQSTTVASRESVRDLGMYMDSDIMSMHKHVTQLVCLCYGVLRQLRSIRRSLPHTAMTTLLSDVIDRYAACYNNNNRPQAFVIG